MTFPLPDQPLPEGWVYIEHPEAGRADNPVPRDALNTWIRAGWSEVAEDESPASPSDAADTTASPRRTRTAAADQVKE